MSTKPWYLPPAAVGDPSSLCETCAYINFQWLLEDDFNHARWSQWKSTPAADDDLTPQPVRIPWVSERREYIFPELSLGFLFEILEKRERCSFCRLVCLTIAAAYRTEPESLLAHTFGDFPSHFVFCRLINRKTAFDQSRTYDLVIDLTNIKPNFLPFKQVTVHRIRDDAIPFEGRIVTGQCRGSGSLMSYPRMSFLLTVQADVGI
jgi:hypothetical protein